MNTSANALKPSAQFRAWLDEQLATRKPGSRIPTADACAEQWCLSRSTITRILEGYQKKGLLVRIPRRGTFIPEPMPAPPAVSFESTSSSQTIVDHIRKAISDGSLRHGDVLPSVKFMSTQFKVAARTVIEAYRRLTRKSLVVKVGKSFWVGSFSELTKLRQGQSIHLFSCSGPDFGRVFDRTVLGFTFAKMEQELLDHGYRLHHEPISALTTLLDKWKRDDRWPEGLFFHGATTGHLATITDARRAVNAARIAPKIPILVDLLSGDFRNLPADTVIFHRGNLDTTVARETASFIKRRRLSPVSFLFDNADLNWSSAFPLIKTAVELKAFDPSYNPALYAFNSEDKTVDQFFERILHLASEARLDSILRKEHAVGVDELKKGIHLIPPDAPFPRDLPTGFWLCGSDTIARKSRGWATANRWALPGDVSIVSLENDPRYYADDISTCVLDWNSAGYRLAHALIGDMAVPRTTKGFVRTQAQVIERGTT